jgi:hypothetical protein
MMRNYEDAIRVFVDTLLYIQRSKPIMVAQTFQNDAVRYDKKILFLFVFIFRLIKQLIK